VLYATTYLSIKKYLHLFWLRENNSKLDHFLFKKLLCILNYAKIHELGILHTHGVYSNSKRTIQHMIFKLCKSGTNLKMPLFKLVFTEMSYVNKSMQMCMSMQMYVKQFFLVNTNYNSKRT